MEALGPIQDRKEEFEGELRELEALHEDPDYPHRDIVLQDVGQTRKVLTIIDSARWR